MEAMKRKKSDLESGFIFCPSPYVGDKRVTDFLCVCVSLCVDPTGDVPGHRAAGFLPAASGPSGRWSAGGGGAALLQAGGSEGQPGVLPAAAAGEERAWGAGTCSQDSTTSLTPQQFIATVLHFIYGIQEDLQSFDVKHK